MARRITRYNNELLFEKTDEYGEWYTLPIEEIGQGLFEVSFYGKSEIVHDANEAFEVYDDMEFMRREQQRSNYPAA